MLIVYLLAPLLDNLFRRIPKKILVALCLVLLALYCADQLYSSKHPNTGDGITNISAEVTSFADPAMAYVPASGVGGNVDKGDKKWDVWAIYCG